MNEPGWSDGLDDDAPPDPVAQGDLNGVLRLIDALVDRRAWADLEKLRQQCRAAYERGHQLWPGANAAAYRLALEAPAAFAVEPVLADDVLFALGPLTEVIAQNHTWDELAPLLPDGPLRAAIAQERILRGDDLSSENIDTAVFGTATTLQSWEPNYELATYNPFNAESPSPATPSLAQVLLPGPGAPIPDDDVIDALRNVVAVWVEQSTGRVDTVAIEGTAEQAIATLGVPGALATDVGVDTALAHLAWAAASGGAKGNRRGMAAGRFEAWWVVAAATNQLDDWPVDPADLSEAASELRWVLWRPGTRPGTQQLGWELHLAIEDPLDGLAWAISAIDQA